MARERMAQVVESEVRNAAVFQHPPKTAFHVRERHYLAVAVKAGEYKLLVLDSGSMLRQLTQQE